MGTPNNSTQHLSEGIETEILARLPLRSISRFKSVCRRWKSALESVYFRRLFVSLHQNSSASWSLLSRRREELINVHGCETWGLPKSLASYFRDIVTVGSKLSLGGSSSTGLILVVRAKCASYVGNPVLQQWVKIPALPDPYSCIPFGLVTRQDKDGVVLGFKVVMLATHEQRDESSTCLCMCVYSSETGIWTCKRLHCPRYCTKFTHPMSLNGTLYFCDTSDFHLVDEPREVLAHDFYGESDLCRVIPLPDHNFNHYRDYKRAFTASSGSFLYIKTIFSQKGDSLLKVWRLNNDSGDECWQLLWELRLQFDIRYHAPMTMHPFDRNVVYLWSHENRCLVSFNLQTQNYKSLNHQDCFMNQSLCEKYMNDIFMFRSIRTYGVPVTLFQFVLPQWMESMPCPPQVEMIYTTSLLSYISLIQEEEDKEEEEEEEEEEEVVWDVWDVWI